MISLVVRDRGDIPKPSFLNLKSSSVPRNSTSIEDHDFLV